MITQCPLRHTSGWGHTRCHTHRVTSRIPHATSQPAFPLLIPPNHPPAPTPHPSPAPGLRQPRRLHSHLRLRRLPRGALPLALRPRHVRPRPRPRRPLPQAGRPARRHGRCRRRPGRGCLHRAHGGPPHERVPPGVLQAQGVDLKVGRAVIRGGGQWEWAAADMWDQAAWWQEGSCRSAGRTVLVARPPTRLQSSGVAHTWLPGWCRAWIAGLGNCLLQKDQGNFLTHLPPPPLQLHRHCGYGGGDCRPGAAVDGRQVLPAGGEAHSCSKVVG